MDNDNDKDIDSCHLSEVVKKSWVQNEDIFSLTSFQTFTKDTGLSCACKTLIGDTWQHCKVSALAEDLLIKVATRELST